MRYLETSYMRKGKGLIDIGLLLSILGLLHSAPVQALEIATLNIRMESRPGTQLDPTEQTWDVRKGPLLKSVLEQGPTIIGFQEPRLRAQTDDVIDGLKSRYDCNAVEIGPGQKYEFNVICWDREAAELVEQSRFWISATPDVPGSKSWGMSRPRMAVLGHFKLRSTGESIWLLNTHLDWDSNRSRAEAVRLIKERTSSIIPHATPFFLVGDFNERIGEEAYTLITGGRYSIPPIAIQGGGARGMSFIDLRRSYSDDNSTPTWEEYTSGTPSDEPMIIDYIFVEDNGSVRPKNPEEGVRYQIEEGGKWKVDDVRVVSNTFRLDDSREYRYSDHRMVIASLS